MPDLIKITPSPVAGAEIPTGRFVLADVDGQPVMLEVMRSQAEQAQMDLAAAVQGHLDGVACSRGYRSMDACVTYVGSGNAAWNGEALAARDFRDRVWTYCYAVLDDVAAGRRPIPAAAELIGELPAIEWPSPPAGDSGLQ